MLVRVIAKTAPVELRSASPGPSRVTAASVHFRPPQAPQPACSFWPLTDRCLESDILTFCRLAPNEFKWPSGSGSAARNGATMLQSAAAATSRRAAALLTLFHALSVFVQKAITAASPQGC